MKKNISEKLNIGRTTKGKSIMGEKVMVPLAQSTITGALLALLVLAGCILAGWSLWWAFLVGIGATLVQWLARTNSAPPLAAEEIPQLDVVRVMTVTRDGKAGTIGELPAAHLRELAQGILEGVPFSESHWTGTAGPFSRAEFGRLRSELIRRGWAYWRNERYHAQGVEFSPSGRAVLRFYSKDQGNGVRERA